MTAGDRAPVPLADAREHVALAGYTTLRLGGPARRLVEAATDEQVVAAIRAADDRGEPLLVLGRGSNLVVADAGFPGTAVRIATKGVRRDGAGGPGAGGPGAGGPGAGGPGAGGNGRDAVELTV